MLKKKKMNMRFSLKADASKVAEYIVEHHKYEVQYITESEIQSVEKNTSSEFIVSRLFW